MDLKKPEVQELKVGASTPVSRLYDAILRYLSEGVQVRLTAVGAGPVNQAVKAAAKSSQMFSMIGKTLLWRISANSGKSGLVEGREISIIVFESVIM